jgi:hypothetical protein
MYNISDDMVVFPVIIFETEGISLYYIVKGKVARVLNLIKLHPWAALILGIEPPVPNE